MVSFGWLTIISLFREVELETGLYSILLLCNSFLIFNKSFPHFFYLSSSPFRSCIILFFIINYYFMSSIRWWYRYRLSLNNVFYYWSLCWSWKAVVWSYFMNYLRSLCFFSILSSLLRREIFYASNYWYINFDDFSLSVS